MAKETKNLYKVCWYTWDGFDRLVIQTKQLEVDEEDIVEDEKTKGKSKKEIPETFLSRIVSKGSVCFTFRNVSNEKELDKYLKDIRDGIRK